MITIKDLKVSFHKKQVIKNFTGNFIKGEIVTIIGANGCGKSTVLKAVAKLVKKQYGTILLKEQDMAHMQSKTIAKQLSILMQSNSCPTSFTVKQLVEYGRIPHQKWYESSDPFQTEVVEWAMEVTGIKYLENRTVMSLSGGERQKVWIATALAQKPEILFLDEPTTYLDICHQLEVMNLVQKLNKEYNLSIVMVLHDLNQAIQFSHKIIAIKDGEIYDYGPPEKVITEKLLEQVYHIKARIGFNTEINSISVTPISLL